MNEKQRIAMLEKVYAREIASAFDKGPLLYQTKSKVANELVEEGLLYASEEKMQASGFNMTIRGFTLTHAGRLYYCMNCEDEAKT